METLDKGTRAAAKAAATRGGRGIGAAWADADRKVCRSAHAKSAERSGESRRNGAGPGLLIIRLQGWVGMDGGCWGRLHVVDICVDMILELPPGDGPRGVRRDADNLKLWGAKPSAKCRIH